MNCTANDFMTRLSLRDEKCADSHDVSGCVIVAVLVSCVIQVNGSWPKRRAL